MPDPFAAAGVDLESAIRSAAEASDVAVDDQAVDAIALHARAVLAENDAIALTAIREPRAFVERHIGESIVGAALVDARASGVLLDLGSGNGYPGLVVAAARRGLSPLLVEAAAKKAAFLRRVVERGFPGAGVLHAHVQRAADLGTLAPIRVLVTRAMGNWERVIPRLVSGLDLEADVLIWAGAEVEPIARRSAWKRLELARRQPIPGRDRSWIWQFRKIRT